MRSWDGSAGDQTAFAKQKASKGRINKRCIALPVFYFVCVTEDVQFPQRRYRHCHPLSVQSKCVFLAAVVSVELRDSGNRDVITKQAVSCCRLHIYLCCNCIKSYHRRCVCGGMREKEKEKEKERENLPQPLWPYSFIVRLLYNSGC
jgi:hypothetical protein